MKKILPILFTVCFTAQFSLAQEQARLSVTPLDSNVTCAKATVIPHTFNKNEFLIDSFANKGGNNAYYTFTATSKSGKIEVIRPNYSINNSLIYIYLDSTICGSGNIIKRNSSTRVDFSNLIIGKKYIISLQCNENPTFKIRVLAYKKDDNSDKSPTFLNLNTNYNFNIADYSFGRTYWTNCNTTKNDSNIILLHVKFKATETSCTLNLNLDNATLESRLFLMENYTCQAIQKNKNLRTDIFTGLTIGNDYTVGIEIGGDVALGYARTATANNASITLVGGSVTGVENNSQSTFSIAPNPSNGNFIFISDENADIIISDLLGSKVADLQNVIPNQNIDLQLAKGIYLLNVSNAKGSKIEKLVIE